VANPKWQFFSWEDGPGVAQQKGGTESRLPSLKINDILKNQI